MKRRIIWNDIKENKLLATTTWFFMTLCAIMFAVTCFLFVNLSGSIDALMEKGINNITIVRGYKWHNLLKIQER